MKIERYGPNWNTVLNVARLTQNKKPIDKEPSAKWKRDLIRSRHSPLRLIQFLVVGEAPGFVCTHLSRHTYQSPQPFVGTARTDIMGTDERPPDTTVRPFAWYFNADSWLDIYEQRACNKASLETRQFVFAMRSEIDKIEPILSAESFRKCEREGCCKEFKPCGYTETAKYKRIRAYYLERE